ncbi:MULTISPECIES: MepB family protein [Leuconostoc]|uniref:MepB protein n=1 Tax=Leuconostoc inhae TaxID=178001 RepID=A0AAN2QV54_9LACO|nr:MULTISPECIES: MepB family protein [Leuconostoc]MBZ5954887.1 MepB family protein [Leuconostoc gasicomitatum]MBZ5957595.1 MepB family protein [Leuconostoc gasicomitatum]MBZ5966893.1 MepB family protein [Leuconostoc gasicomitatum]MBZ5980113.1 MepB family protein [Leuconostoc gasicomitatum]MBZ5981802.1 MepB family protein [Leuconostoc gasicomitatum]
MNQSLELIKRGVTTELAYNVEQMSEESQNVLYEGFRFRLKNKTFRSRLAKKTPTKKGYFVAFWEKDNHAKNKPFDYESSPDFLIINVIDFKNQGQFIFPKALLAQKKILLSLNSKGKMAIRVYPEWVKELNKTAFQTQQWQLHYFIDLSKDLIDVSKLKQLYTI